MIDTKFNPEIWVHWTPKTGTVSPYTWPHSQGRREGGAEGVICPRASDIQGPPMLVVNAPMVRGGGLYPTVMPRASICLSAALLMAERSQNGGSRVQ